jgi:hypothetical protein
MNLLILTDSARKEPEQVTPDMAAVSGTVGTVHVGVLISLWLFLYAAQPKEVFLDGLKKLEERSHKCVELRGQYVE